MDKIFQVKPNQDLIYQVVNSQLSLRRQKTAHTKDRKEVSGGGRKPWRQKGTGRARHGSSRSPLWKGGGVTFGPRNERNFKKHIPLQIKRKALLMVLSAKKNEDLIIFTDKIIAEKTKEMVNLLKKLSLDSQSVLIILGNDNIKVVRASRNIPKVNVTRAKDLNALDLLQYKYLLMEKEAPEIIEKTFIK